jgi:hypothetical protein
MRRIVLSSLFLLLCAVPVAAADDHPSGPRAAGITADHATLQAYVDPGTKGATAAFEYGTTIAYGTSVVAAPAKLPDDGAVASASVAGLQAATTYHFRVVVTVKGVQTPGPDATFTTLAAPADDAPAPVAAPRPPVLGRSVAVGPVAGTVRVRTPNGRVVTLAKGADVPSGSIVDATEGTVALTSAQDGAGATQTGVFGGGRFVVRQAKRGMVDIYLRGLVGPCVRSARLATAAAKRKTRSLWGRDHGGRFRTHGANSVATVRGTRWHTTDSCAGTRTRVTDGVVSVRDLRRHRTVTVRAGHSYLARRGR